MAGPTPTDQLPASESSDDAKTESPEMLPVGVRQANLNMVLDASAETFPKSGAAATKPVEGCDAPSRSILRGPKQANGKMAKSKTLRVSIIAGAQEIGNDGLNTANTANRLTLRRLTGPRTLMRLPAPKSPPPVMYRPEKVTRDAEMAQIASPKTIKIVDAPEKCKVDMAKFRRASEKPGFMTSTILKTGIPPSGIIRAPPHLKSPVPPLAQSPYSSTKPRALGFPKTKRGTAKASKSLDAKTVSPTNSGKSTTLHTGSAKRSGSNPTSSSSKSTTTTKEKKLRRKPKVPLLLKSPKPLAPRLVDPERGQSRELRSMKVKSNEIKLFRPSDSKSFSSSSTANRKVFMSRTRDANSTSAKDHKTRVESPRSPDEVLSRNCRLDAVITSPDSWPLAGSSQAARLARIKSRGYDRLRRRCTEGSSSSDSAESPGSAPNSPNSNPASPNEVKSCPDEKRSKSRKKKSRFRMIRRNRDPHQYLGPREGKD